MLPFKVSATQHAAFSDELKTHYVKKGEDYVLETIGDHPQVTSMQQQLAQMGITHANLQQRNNELTGQIATAEQTAEAKYKADLDATTAKLNKIQEKVANDTRATEIQAIAGRFNNSELFAGTLESRIKTEVAKDGTVAVKFYNKDGAEVDRQVLHDEFLKNASYSAMLKKDGTPTINNTPAPKSSTPAPNTQTSDTSPVWSKTSDGKVAIDMSRASDAEMAAAIAAQREQQAQA
jgi:hypothetical protein